MSLTEKQKLYTCDVCGNKFTTRRQDVIASGLCPDCYIEASGVTPRIPAKPVEIKNNIFQRILDREKAKKEEYISRDFMFFEEMKLYHIKIISETREIETKYGTQTCFDVLNLEDNVEYTVIPHLVLARKLKSKQFLIDSEIGVINKGKVIGAKGSFQYYDYEVFKWDPNMLTEE